MRVVIVGAGALGTCYAALLARAGAKVAALVRAERRDAYGETLRVSGLIDADAPVRVITSGKGIDRADYLILATKARDTAGALSALDGLEVDTALSLQNGLDKNVALIERYGKDRVIAAACSVGASLPEPGHARLTMNVATWLGEPQGEPTERIVRLVAALRAAGFPSHSVRNGSAVEWFKLCFLIPGAVVTALSRRTYRDMCLHPELAPLWVALMRETYSVPRALGVPLETPPASPWKVMDWLDQPDDVAVAGLNEIGRSTAPEMRPSMAQDVLAGRRTEAEEVLAPLIREAMRAGVAVPRVEAAYQLIRGLEETF
ncbi:MAG TPA: 2-dehydropantoate 2-reductase [Chloroflexota bacterium]|nr:2-dehydropantoate 2-reductase [Chloroflexota bacterium]